MIIKFKAIYKKHRPRAIPYRLASGSARGQNMKNEPNLPNTQRRKNEKRTQFSQGFIGVYPALLGINRKSTIELLQISAIIYPPKEDFPQKSQKNARLMYNFENNTLNYMYNKDLHKHSPQNTLHKSSNLGLFFSPSGFV